MYALIHFFVPAVVFVSIIDKCKIFNINFFGEHWFVQIALLYIIGVTLHSIGIVIVQPIMEMLKIINVSDCEKYIKYCDDITNLAKGVAEELRSYTALFFILTLFTQNNMTILWVFLTLVFGFTYRKQLHYVQKRLDCNANKEENISVKK